MQALGGYFESEMGSFSRELLEVNQGKGKYHFVASITLTIIFVVIYLLLGFDGILSSVSLVLRAVGGTICMFFILSLMVMHSRYLFSHTTARLTVVDVFLIYVCFIFEFTCAYILCHVYQPEAFKNKVYHDQSLQSQMEGLEGVFRFFFLSISTQTHIGLCDMTPWSPLANLVSTFQMALGMVQIVAFLVWIHRVEVDATEIEAIFRRGSPEHSRSLEPTRPYLVNHSPPLLPRNPSPATASADLAGGEETELISSDPSSSHLREDAHTRQRRKRTNRSRHNDVDDALKGCGRFFYQNLFLVVFGLQCLNGLVLDAADMPSWMVFSTLTWQILLIVMLLVASYYLALFTKIHLIFLAQSYGATSLAFAGAYVALAIYEPMAFSVPLHVYGATLNTTGVSEVTAIQHGYEDEFFAMAIDYLHFSFAIMTCTGMSDLTPRNMASRGLAGVHMLIAVLFNVIIIGLGMRDFGTPILIKAPGDDDYEVNETGPVLVVGASGSAAEDENGEQVGRKPPLQDSLVAETSPG